VTEIEFHSREVHAYQLTLSTHDYVAGVVAGFKLKKFLLILNKEIKNKIILNFKGRKKMNF
jgi:hypothetical protein